MKKETMTYSQFSELSQSNGTPEKMDEEYNKSLNFDQNSNHGNLLGKRKNSVMSGVKVRSDKNSPRKMSIDLTEKPKGPIESIQQKNIGKQVNVNASMLKFLFKKS